MACKLPPGLHQADRMVSFPQMAPTTFGGLEVPSVVEEQDSQHYAMAVPTLTSTGEITSEVTSEPGGDSEETETYSYDFLPSMALVGIPSYFLCGINQALRLACPSWFALTLVAMPGRFVGGTLVGWVVASFTQPKCGSGRISFVLGLSCMVTSIFPLAFGMLWLGPPSFVFTVVLWCSVLMPFSRNVCIGFVVLSWMFCIQTAFMMVASALTTIRAGMPLPIMGATAPLAVALYEVVAYRYIRLAWNRRPAGLHSRLFSTMCALIVQSAETLRFVGLLAASLQDDLQLLILDTSVNLGVGLLCDLVYRGRVVEGLWALMLNRAVAVSPEMDCFLRARFFFGYTIIVPFLSIVPLVNVGGLPWAKSLAFWVLFGLGLTWELVSDILFIQLQRDRGSEASFRDTMRRLQMPGRHRPYSFVTTPVVPIEANTNGRRSAALSENEGMRELVTSCKLPPAVAAGFLIYHSRLMLFMSLNGIFGVCGVTVPLALC
eukprot:TRINITY_DN75955_c0_g1_i1.p1 TRINITY_DN75955_c0_g1~~TRINITY_DN75955_c0_g1_i1.p1  ORF type:complete len:490 (-),score=23.58 TRINITY_DN75955_c0_g1_i1:166-1635(-)